MVGPPCPTPTPPSAPGHRRRRWLRSLSAVLLPSPSSRSHPVHTSTFSPGPAVIPYVPRTASRPIHTPDRSANLQPRAARNIVDPSSQKNLCSLFQPLLSLSTPPSSHPSAVCFNPPSLSQPFHPSPHHHKTSAVSFNLCCRFQPLPHHTSLQSASTLVVCLNLSTPHSSQTTSAVSFYLCCCFQPL
jgi:hypothetical protein